MQVARTPASDDKMPSQENKNTEEEDDVRRRGDQSQSTLALASISLKFRSIYLQNSNLTAYFAEPTRSQREGEGVPHFTLGLSQP